MWMSRLKLLALLLGITLAAGLLLGWLLPRILTAGNSSPQILNTATVLRQVQSLSHLVTVKYVLEKVVVLEDVKWYGQSRVLLIAHGVAKAGVDLSQIGEADVRIRDRTITVTVPEPTITDVYLDDQKTRIVERSTGILRTFDKDLEQNARRQAIDDIKRGARASGIQEDARERATRQLQSLFSTLGYERVDVRFKR